MNIEKNSRVKFVTILDLKFKITTPKLRRSDFFNLILNLKRAKL